MAGETATVFGVGDVFLNVPDGRASLRPLTPLLETAEVVFGNCEGVYSDRPCLSPARRHFMGAPRERGGMLGEAPFQVMTCANNHTMDGGGIGLSDTIALLREQGIAVTGAGEDLADATSPATIEANGLRLAFLGFCSVFPVGHEARPDRPGIAPLRVRTIYQEPDRSFWEPGIDPLIATEALSGDLDGFRDSIAAARSSADFVVVACHWGYSSRLELLHDYELELARQAVACGADAVLCHHHHSLRGIEMYRGRPIFYGLGALIHHFAEGQLLTPQQVAERRSRFGALASFGEDPEYPLFPFHPDARMTGIAVLELGREGEIECGFIPALMLPDGSAEPLRAEDERAGRVLDYVRRLSEQSGFDTRFGTAEREGWSLLRIAAPGRAGAAARQVRDRAAAAGERHTATRIER